MVSSDSVTEFFAGKCILITGATGFLGKALLEKLLRSCPDINTVFVIIRAKPGFKNVQERLEKLTQNPVRKVVSLVLGHLFDQIRKDNPQSLNKIHAIAGDIGLPDLNLTELDKHLLLTNVSVVFHSAATVSFNAPLHIAVEQNVQGTRRIVAFCKQMKQFQSLCHVSTAYANCDRNENFIEEEVYPVPPGTENLLLLPLNKKCTEFSADFVGSVKSFRPNSYTYTKAIAEYILNKEAREIPVCIVRPSMVTASSQEPVPGWVEGVNGPSGVFTAMGTGALKVLFANSNMNTNIIPVDTTVNVIICAAWKAARTGATQFTKVYNCCAPENESLKQSYIHGLMENMFCEKTPFSKAAMYPQSILTTSKLWFKLNDICWHYIPAVLSEIFYLKRRIRPLTLYKRMSKQMKALEFYMTHSWKFSTNNMFMLHQELSVEDREEFQLNLAHFDWHKYIENYAIGIRRHIMNDPDSTILLARKRINKLKFRTKCWKIFICTWTLVFAFFLQNFVNNIKISIFGVL